MDQPMFGSGKLFFEKSGKILVKGDDNVVSANLNESHRLVTQKNPDGTSQLYMVPSEGVNKGKFFLVMPEKNKSVDVPKPPDSVTVLADSDSLLPTFGSPGQRLLSSVLKNIANRITSESKSTGETKQEQSNSTTPPSNQNETSTATPATCESRTNQGCDTITKPSVIDPKPSVTQLDTNNVFRNSSEITILDASLLRTQSSQQAFSPSMTQPTIVQSSQLNAVQSPQPSIVQLTPPANVKSIQATFLPSSQSPVVQSAQTYQPNIFTSSQSSLVQLSQPAVAQTFQPTVAQSSHPPVIQASRPTVVQLTPPANVKSIQETYFQSSQSPVVQSAPTYQPNVFPPSQPTVVQLSQPAIVQTPQPTAVQSLQPPLIQLSQPAVVQTSQPTAVQLSQPAVVQTPQPTIVQSLQPPVMKLSQAAVAQASQSTVVQLSQPAVVQTSQPAVVQLSQPAVVHTSKPTVVPTSQPAVAQTSWPPVIQLSQPTVVQLSQPAVVQTSQPAVVQTSQPTGVHTSQPTAVPPSHPTSVQPSQLTTVQPSQPLFVQSSQPVVILTTGAIPASSMLASAQSLLTTINMPRLPSGTSLTQSIAKTTPTQTTGVVCSSTLSQTVSSPLSSTPMVMSNQMTLGTTPINMQLQNACGVDPSLQIPLVPVLIQTNSVFPSAPIVTTPAVSLPSRSISTISNSISQNKVSVVRANTGSDTTNTSKVKLHQQTPVVALTLPPATQNPIFVTAKEAAALLNKSPLPTNKTLQGTVAAFLKNRKITPQPPYLHGTNVTLPQTSSVPPSTGFATSSLTTTLTNVASLPRTVPEVVSVPTTLHVETVSNPKSADENPFIISETREPSCEKPVTCSTDETTMLPSRFKDGTLSGNATPMLLFSHNAARNLKPNGLLDPIEQRSGTLPHTTVTTTTKSLPVTNPRQIVLSKPSKAHLGVDQKHTTGSALDDGVIYKYVVGSGTTAKTKTVAVYKVDTSNEQKIFSFKTGDANTSSPKIPTSVVVTSAVPITKSTESDITPTNKINSKSQPMRYVLASTSSQTKTSTVLSYTNALPRCSSSSSASTKPKFPYVMSKGKAPSSPFIITPVQTPSSTSETVSNEPQVPRFIITKLPPWKKTVDNANVGNLVSIFPRRSNISSISYSKIPIQKSSSVQKSSSKTMKDIIHPILQNNSKDDTKAMQSKSAAFPTLSKQLKASGNVNPVTEMRTEEMPIRIDSVFSLSSKEQALKIETPDLHLKETEHSFCDNKKVHFNNSSRIQGFKSEESPTTPKQHPSRIFKELDHLSNFNGIVLPDEAIRESKLFSPCHVVLEQLHMHGGKMKGVNTRCSRACRKRFLSKKSNIRLSIHKTISDSKHEDSKQKPSPARKSRGRKETTTYDLDNNGHSNHVNLERSREIVDQAFSSRRTAIKNNNDGQETNGMSRNRQVTSAAVKPIVTIPSELTESDQPIVTIPSQLTESDQPTMTIPSQLTESDQPTVKTPSQLTELEQPVVTTPSQLTVSDREQYYVVQFDGRTILFPKSTLNLNKKRNLTPSASDKASVEDLIRRTDPVFNRKSSKSSNAAPTGAKAFPDPSPSALPTTSPTQINIKPEPVTHGYGDEASIQPVLSIKQERMDKGYPDEPPKLARMDIEPPAKSQREMVLKRENPIPELTAEEIPTKIPKVISNEERISNLKELLKKQEKDLEEIKQRRLVEATPVDLDF
ncbi:mucin-2-like [Argopecten irradians]|uniref:mucin-2-like n=1 Tax=Argopecten irradians TaxID=31199 RepID=UPI00372240F5